MSITKKHLMSIKIRILKDKRSLSGKSTTAGTRDGESCTLTNQSKKQLVDSTENMDSTLTDHSSSDPDSQCKELSNLSHGTPDLEDTMLEEETNRLGDSTENLTLLQIKTGRTTHLTSTTMERDHTLEYKEPIQDGGRCSE
jgi:hypothetical protein